MGTTGRDSRFGVDVKVSVGTAAHVEPRSANIGGGRLEPQRWVCPRSRVSWKECREGIDRGHRAASSSLHKCRLGIQSGFLALRPKGHSWRLDAVRFAPNTGTAEDFAI